MRLLPWAGVLLTGVTLLAQNDFAEGMDAYRRGDYASAISSWQPLAEEGSPEAQFNLGLIHQHGQGVEADPSVAAEWYGRAAEQGFNRAQYNLAKLYETGDGVPLDRVLAYFWYRLAGIDKHADARKRRKAVAKQLSPYDLAQADLLVRQWQQKRKAQPTDQP